MSRRPLHPRRRSWPGLGTPSWGLRTLVAGSAFCGMLACSGLKADLVLHPATDRVGRFERIEFRIDGVPESLRPFDPAEVDVRLEIRTSTVRQVTVPAFQMQPYERRRLPGDRGGRDWMYPVGLPVWRARFAPQEIGPHEAVAVLIDRSGTNRSAPVAFDCLASQAKGFVRVSHADPRFFELTDGEPFFPIGQNLAFIGSQQYVTLGKAEEIFAKLAANGANYLRLWTCCSDWALAIEARKSAWNRSWGGRPPLVPMPGDENRRCLAFTPSNAVHAAEPSHPVALRPGSRYVLSGRVRTEPGTALQVEVHGMRSPAAVASAPPLAWTAFRHEFSTATDDFRLGPTRFRSQGDGLAWLSDVSLKEAGEGPELLWEAEMNRPARGFYNPLDGFMLDALVEAAERHGLRLQLCLLTRDLYMSALKDPSSADYDRAIADARNLLRYAVARWGASTSVAVWEYWNEMDPGLPTDRFYAELGTFLRTIDPYGHLRSTSTWGPSAKDARHPELDLADAHFYLRPADRGRLADEVDAVLDRARWLRQQTPARPALLGEFGLADDQWRITEEMRRAPEIVDAHNVLWASALSGASGSALFWWWERLDERNVYPLYRSVSRFLTDVPWNGGRLQPLAGRCSDERCRVIGLRAGGHAWVWVFDPAAAWDRVVTARQTPPERQGLTLELDGFSASRGRMVWWDTHAGTVLKEEILQPGTAPLRLQVPTFRGDIACRVTSDE